MGVNWSRRRELSERSMQGLVTVPLQNIVTARIGNPIKTASRATAFAAAQFAA